jgi:hypothetical protein
MIKLYKYLYYRLYTWNLRIWGEKDLPQWNAMFGVSFMMFMNICTIGFLLEVFGFIKIFDRQIPKIIVIIVMLIIFIVNYFQYIHNRGYNTITAEYKNEAVKRKKWNILLIWGYALLSFILCFTTMALLHK